MVFTHHYACTWKKLSATLTNNDIAWFGKLTAIYFYAQSLAVGISTVFGTAFTFFMCHNFLLFNVINFNLCQILTVSVQFAISFPSFLFEHKHFIAFQMLYD